MFQPKPYSFTYGVKDYNSGTDFSRNEERSGAVTKGEYRTALPDGRIQIVSYVADHNGYKASVTYEGTPNYPAPGKPYTPSKDVFTVFPDSYEEPLPVKPAHVPPPPHPSPKPAYHPPPPTPTPKPAYQSYAPPTPTPKPAYQSYAPPPPKPKYEKFRHSNKVLDPFKVIDPYTKNGKVVGLDYDYYDYNDIYSSSKPTPNPTYQPYKPPPPPPSPKPTYHPPPPTPTPRPAYESYAPPPPKQYHPVNAYKPPPVVVTTPVPAPIITTTHASYAPPTPTPAPTYANAYSPSPSYTAPQPTLHHVNVQPASPAVPFRGLNFRDQPAPTESTFRGARKREVPGSSNKKSKLPTYPNFKPVFTTASSLLDYDDKNYDYNDYKDDYEEESVTLPSRINTVTATTPRPRVTSTTTPTYYSTTASPSTRGVTPSASLLHSPKGFNSFTRTTTPPYTTNKLYITTPKPYYGGPWSPNYVENNYDDSDLNSSPSHVTPSTVVQGSSKSSKITTYRPNGFTPTSLKYKKKQKNKQKYARSKSSETSNNFESSNTSSSSYDDSYDLGIDYYDYYYDAALDYLQGRISQLNSKNNNHKKNNSNNKHTNNNRYNKHKRPTKSTSKGKWNRRNVNNKNN